MRQNIEFNPLEIFDRYQVRLEIRKSKQHQVICNHIAKDLPVIPRKIRRTGKLKARPSLSILRQPFDMILVHVAQDEYLLRRTLDRAAFWHLEVVNLDVVIRRNDAVFGRILNVLEVLFVFGRASFS